MSVACAGLFVSESFVMKKLLLLLPLVLLGACNKLTPEQQAERRQFFLACVERGASAPSQYADNADVVEQCELAAQRLYHRF